WTVAGSGTAGGGTGGCQTSGPDGLLEIAAASCTGAGGTAAVSGTRLLAAGAASTGAGFSASSGSHPMLRDLPAAICSNPPMRQSFALLLDFDSLDWAAGTTSSSAVAAGLQAAGSSSSSTSISSSARLRQSCSFGNSGEVFVAKLESSTVSSIGVSSRLPNATGCELESIFNGSGFAGTSSTKLSLAASGLLCMRNSGTGVAPTIGTLPLFGVNIPPAPKASGSATFAAGTLTWPGAERCSADFTIEINGSGGINGFFRTPSAPTLWASCSSRGSKAPTNRITGICDSAESIFTNWQTS